MSNAPEPRVLNDQPMTENEIARSLAGGFKPPLALCLATIAAMRKELTSWTLAANVHALARDAHKAELAALRSRVAAADRLAELLERSQDELEKEWRWQRLHPVNKDCGCSPCLLMILREECVTALAAYRSTPKGPQ